MRYRTLRVALAMVVWFAASSLWAGLPFPPEPVKGVLLVTGNGEPSDAVRAEFVKQAGGKEKARIVIVTVAVAQAKTTEEGDPILRNWNGLVVSPKIVRVIEGRPTASDALKAFVDATAIWFDGAKSASIAQRDESLSKEIQSVFKRGGVIGGPAEFSDLTIEAKAGWGMLPGIVIDRTGGDLPKTLASHPEFAGLRLDEQGALLIRGRRIRNIGEKPAKVLWSKSPDRELREDALKSGAELDLIQVRRAAHFRAIRPEFPPSQPPVPEVSKGSLVIVGGGGTTQAIMDKFFALAGGKDALIVVIPTANEEEIIPEDPGDAKYLRKWGATNVKVLHTRDRAKANDPDFSKILTEAKGVWFGGGRQWRFVDSYEGTLTEKRFHEVLQRGGVIGGSSAGASIQSEYMPRGHPLGNTVVAAEGYEHGFGFLPGCAVDQHFFARKRTGDMTAWMKNHPNWLGIGLDEATAIVVTGHIAEVVGKSKVAFYNHRQGVPKGDKDFIELLARSKFDLKERKVVASTDAR